MLLWLQKLLSTEQVKQLRELAARERFVDGRKTAGRLVEPVKRNQEIDIAGEAKEALGRLILGTLNANQTFIVGARPRRILPPIISRYENGMTYGEHVDNALMGPPLNPVRVDLSITIFLSDPTTYDGGELVIHTDYGAQEIKLPPGDAIVYPTTFIHRVNPVTRGVRLAAITWIESLVRDARQRQMLYDVSVLAEWVHKQVPPQSGEAKLVEKIRMNLLRMWADA